MIYFCGYPVDGKPCGKHATPGCAFCVADSLSMDTGHGPLLTEQDIVDRATERRWRWYWRVSWCFPVAIVLLWVVALYPHSWTVYLRAHVEFLWGVLAGSLLQALGWLRDRWRRLKRFSR